MPSKKFWKILKPDLVVGWGYTLEEKFLPQKTLGFINRTLKYHLFTLDGFPLISFWCMHHPSMGCEIDLYREIFRDIKSLI